ncbi:MAG: TetR/AcrR family transcriptional regulator [Desulfobacterales bacterium]|nr:TetR/AcrR family transcriptional regulator [Deltaproteobacteria bacterium]NNK94987.1 TetR/AcrR family transcriptional regulator [Desulfobacterales bacterium]
MDKSKKQKRQEAILSTALRLFTNMGYFNTSVSDIQLSSDMSVGTLYNYFQNKESIAITLYRNIENCLYEALCEIEKKHDNAHSRCRAVINHMFDTTERNSDVMQYLLYTKHREFMPVEKSVFASLPFLKMKDFVIQGQKDGEIRKIEPNVAMNAILGSAIHMIFLRIDGVLDDSLQVYFEDSWECSWRGVRA